MLQRVIIASNLWVGLAVAVLSFLSFPNYLSGEAILYSLFMLFGTAAAYSYMRWVKLIQGEVLPDKPKIGWNDNLIMALIITFSAGIISLAFLKQIFTWSLAYALAPGFLIAILYPLAFPYPNRYFSSLRSIPMLKLLLIAFAWSWLTFAVPHLLSGAMVDFRFSAEVILRMFLVAGLTIPFDVRDLQLDRPQLKTLPQQLGLSASLQLAQFMVLIYQLWVVLSFFIWNLSLSHTIAWVLGLEIGQWLIGQVNKNRSDQYISFWIEAIPIVVLFIFFLSELAMRNF